jgi:hypothetical protein
MFWLLIAPIVYSGRLGYWQYCVVIADIGLGMGVGLKFGYTWEEAPSRPWVVNCLMVVPGRFVHGEKVFIGLT